MKILVAEDNPSTRTMIAMTLKKWGHDVIEVPDGRKAWEALCREEISFVITDWMMPEMDGPNLCRRVRKADFPRYVYIILLTAKDAKTELVEGMEAGADDFLVKPFHKDELNVRIRAGERILDLEKKLEDRNRQLQDACFVMKKDLEAAAKIQKSLLPKSAETLLGVRFDWIFEPCAFVAGDIFNFLRLDENHVGFYILDVSGHGTPAALLSVTLSRVLSHSGLSDSLLKESISGAPYYELLSPSWVVQDLNRRFQSDEETMQYFTMIYGIIDSKNGNVRMTQAGHPSPIILKQDGTLSTLGKGGFPVGMLPEVDFEEIGFQLSRGDRLILYSDGVTECINEHKEMLSEERFLTILQKERRVHLDSFVKRIGDSLRKWKGEGEFQDDVTLLVLERF